MGVTQVSAREEVLVAPKRSEGLPERSEGATSSERPAVVPPAGQFVPDPEVSARPVRRRFTAEYKHRILREADYRRLLKEGANVVVLEPDIAKAFRSSAAVNEALRSLLKVSESTRRLTTRSSGRAKGARR